MTTRKLGNVDVSLDANGFVESIQLRGRPLFLTADAAFLKTQFRGESLDPAPTADKLYSHVSTDAIIKANPDCYYYDDRLGTLVLRSLGNGRFVEPRHTSKSVFPFPMLFQSPTWPRRPNGVSRGFVCSGSPLPFARS